MHILCSTLSSQFLNLPFSDLCHYRSASHPSDLSITGNYSTSKINNSNVSLPDHNLLPILSACSFDHSLTNILGSHLYLHSIGHSIFSVFPTSLLSSFSSLPNLCASFHFGAQQILIEEMNSDTIISFSSTIQSITKSYNVHFFPSPHPLSSLHFLPY